MFSSLLNAAILGGGVLKSFSSLLGVHSLAQFPVRFARRIEDFLLKVGKFAPKFTPFGFQALSAKALHRIYYAI